MSDHYALQRESDGLHITIEGTELWRRPQTAPQAAEMARLVKLSGEPAGRCATCAFRAGSVPNASAMTVVVIGHCLTNPDSTFMCHEVAEGDERPCVGYAALVERLRGPADV